MNSIKILWHIFLILTFFVGLYLIAVYRPTKNTEDKISKNTKDPTCPDMLIKKGNVILLYNSKEPMVDKMNPIQFNSLDEYKKYIEKEKPQCPPLFLQHEYNTQGNSIYRAYNSPFNMEGGLPYKIYEGLETKQPATTPFPIIDSSRGNGEFNANNYPGFDPNGYDVGKYTKLDEIHESTKENKLSDNPMDSNWGGVMHTQQRVDEGVYADNEVKRPNLMSAKNMTDLDVNYGFPPRQDVIE
jgi:hypothetical protein